MPLAVRCVPRGIASVACLSLLAVVLGPTSPADGHASSQLPHARWSAEGEQVAVTWTAAPDDAADVAVAAGLWPEEAMWAFLDGDPDALPTEEEITALGDEPALHEYLLEGFEVSQDGRSCPAELRLTDDFVTDGAELTFTCEEPAADVALTVSLLHDRDPSYRTFSVDGSEQYAVHTASQPTHEWDFALGAERELPWGLVAAAVGLVLVAAASLVVVSRRPARQRRLSS